MIPDTTDSPPADTDDESCDSGYGPGWYTTAAVLAVVFLVVAAPLVPGVVVADHGEDDDAPSVPASYYGDVNVNGDPADTGTEITAIVNGESHGSIEVSDAGSYGGSGSLDDKLVVEGAESGDTVSFEVRGVEAEETVSWESGDVQEVDLTFEDVPESDDSDGENTDDDSDENTEEDNGGGGGGAAPAPPAETEEPAAATDTPDGGETTPGPDEEIDGVEDVSDTEVVDRAEADISTGSGDDTLEATFDSDVPVQAVEFESSSGESGTSTESGTESGSESNTPGSVEVVEVSDPPSETGDPPGSTTTVTDVQVPEEVDDQSATLEMRVSDDRLAETDATAEDLRVHRYADGEWQPLETRVADETDNGVILAADTPGFSFFATSAVGEPDAELSLSADTVDAGTTVTLDGTGSADPYGEIESYTWRIAEQELTGETTSLALDDPGEYTVELVVTNDAGETDTTTETLVVSESGSTGQGTAAAADSSDAGNTAASGDSGDAGSENGPERETLGATPPIWLIGVGAVLIAVVLGVTVALRRNDSSQERL